MVTIGDLRDIRGDVNLEWKINDFLQLSKKDDKYYASPKFFFCGSSWEIWIYPNGCTTKGSVKWIGLYLAPKYLSAPISVDNSLYFETVNGKADTDAKFTSTHKFDEENAGWGRDKFILRSKLIERKSELLPSGILTVIGILKKSGINSGVGSANVDEITHSEEETGVYKLQQHFKEILENGNVSDVVLKVEDRQFKSHRCVLAARSPVFLAMMTHDTKEKKTGVVDIQDVDSNTFCHFLRYLYTGSRKIITSENAVKLYTAADKYQVDELKKSCLNYMLKNISVNNFCDILSLSLKYVEKDLKDACSQFFMENTVAIISTPMWLTFIEGNPVAGNELHLKHLKSIMKDKN